MGVGIIVCGGSGQRFGSVANKVFAELSKKTLLGHCLSAFDKAEEIEYNVVVAKKNEWETIRSIPHKKKIKFTEGGKERMHSVLNGVKLVEEETIVAVHNGANPSILPEEIDKVVRAAKKYGGAIVGFPVVDTLKRTDEKGIVVETIERKLAWHAQTPQAASSSLLMKAYEEAITSGRLITDEAMAVELAGHKVKMVECTRMNQKVTYPEDLPRLENVRESHKIGFGKDTHEFEEEKVLMLGGVRIPYAKGLKGNSDGDAVLHAVGTAMMQAIGGHSLGRYTDPWCLEESITDSKEYIRRFKKIMTSAGSKVVQVGVMIEAKEPKLDPHLEKVKEVLGKLLAIDKSAIGISATSGEGLNSALTSYAVVWVAPWRK